MFRKLEGIQSERRALGGERGDQAAQIEMRLKRWIEAGTRCTVSHVNGCGLSPEGPGDP